MPVLHERNIPKSASCDDKLFYRAAKEEDAVEEKPAEVTTTIDCDDAPRPPLQMTEKPKPVEQTHRWTSNGGSTHNERARQRMERVRLATMKREQARLEEQNRKEVARLTRKLAAEQEQRKALVVSNCMPLGETHGTGTDNGRCFSGTGSGD